MWDSYRVAGTFAFLYASTKVLPKRVAGSFLIAADLKSSNMMTTRE